METETGNDIEDVYTSWDASAGEMGRQQIAAHRRKLTKEPYTHGTIVVKIGGSTLGDHDTSLEDLVTLQGQGVNSVVVHGGGKMITEWMSKQRIRPRFVRGLRVTDPRSLDIVVAVLAGLVNKTLVSSIEYMGGKALGISGADGGILQARLKDPELGLVGDIARVNPEAINALIELGYIPVIAPVALDVQADSAGKRSLLNINADTAAGAIAAAIQAERIIFLTDVEGVMDSSRRLIPRMTLRQVKRLMQSKVVAGGMVPKLEACVTALMNVNIAQILDGRKPRALMNALSDGTLGTRVS